MVTIAEISHLLRMHLIQQKSKYYLKINLRGTFLPRRYSCSTNVISYDTKRQIFIPILYLYIDNYIQMLCI